MEDAGIIYCEDCRDILPHLPKVDLVLTDPPYGITSNKWDICVDITFFPMPILCFASQPFSSLLVASMIDSYKHEWIWVKNRGSNFANTVREPMKEHEHILFFAEKPWTYNQQKQERTKSGKSRTNYNIKFDTQSENYRQFNIREKNKLPIKRVPSSIQLFNTDTSGYHPTIKPVKLLLYLIKTYSNGNDIIFDPFLGSGTTAVAAKELGRKFIGIEIEERYCAIAVKRLRQGVLDFNR